MAIYEKLQSGTFPVTVQRFYNHSSKNRIHWHEQVELLYFTEGSAVTLCNGQEHEAKAGDLIVVNSNELHVGIVSSAQSRYYCLHVKLDFFTNRIGDQYVFFENHIRDARCSELLENIVRNAPTPDFRGEIAVKKDLYALFDILCRDYVKYVSSEAEYRKYYKRYDRFTAIADYIEENYYEDLSVTDLARTFSMSETYFAHFFKKEAGKSVIAYVNEVRIRHAKAFLEKDDMAIGEIAERVGFNDLNYFSRKFKEITGMSPSAYKNLG
ncbi:MAG: AraC family transcriptional regulator [Firmicutes bacterium]|nr:AraC family transcriptional regulator [Bacillota bacterium]